jgi:hypothetical protein
VVSLCKYFLQQGYKQDQLVVLTPYLAQMRELRTALANGVTSAFVSSMDMKDLMAAGGDPDIPKDTKKGIRVATIDNYQGEESDVVIASLVRSNKSGDVGFIGDSNRVNVLLSRARHGMVLVGNLDCLTKAKSRGSRELWQKVERQMKADNSIYSSFPALCANHNTLSQICSPEDFQQLAPDGGCNAVCGTPLPCQHKCPKKCHPFNLAHKGIRCKESARVTCPFNHPLVQLCSEAVPTCITCQKLAEMKAKEEERRKAEVARIAAEQAEIELKLQEEKLYLQRKEDELNQVLARIKQEENIEKLKIDAERIQKEIDIKMQEERAVQERKLAELEQETKQRFYELQQETANKTKQANDSAKQRTTAQQAQSPVQQKVDVVLALSQSVRAVDTNGFRQTLSSIPLGDRSNLAEFLIPRIGIAALDWLAIPQSEGAAKPKEDKSPPGLDSLAKGEWMKARSFFLAKREKNEREGVACLETELACLLASSKLKLGDDPATYLNELYLIDAQISAIHNNTSNSPRAPSSTTNSSKFASTSNSNVPYPNPQVSYSSTGSISSPSSTSSSSSSNSTLTTISNSSEPSTSSTPTSEELEERQPKKRHPAKDKPSQPPRGLRSLTFAVVHDLMAGTKPTATPAVPHSVEAAAHALSFLAFPASWKKDLAKLEILAKDIVKKHKEQLNEQLGHVCTTPPLNSPRYSSIVPLFFISGRIRYVMEI